MLLFVGLGNPTADSENNRHNVGFKIIDLEFNDINGGSFALTVAKKSNYLYEETKRLIIWVS